MESVEVVTRPIAQSASLLKVLEACREAEEFLQMFEVLYPNESLVRLALRGVATYQLSWFDAHLWAYAEYYGISEIISEDFQHDRFYGTVQVINPFLE